MRSLLIIFCLALPAVLNAQPEEKTVTIPDSVKKRCDDLIISEVGKDIYELCVLYKKSLVNKRTFGNGEVRSDYTITYSFRFPQVHEASFNFGFVYTEWAGKERLVSSAFLRNNQTDLPPCLKKSGLKILNYQLVKTVALNQNPEMKKHCDEVKGILVLTQDSLSWHFSVSIPQPNPGGDAEIFINHHVCVDPYTGVVTAKYSD